MPSLEDELTAAQSAEDCATAHTFGMPASGSVEIRFDRPGAFTVAPSQTLLPVTELESEPITLLNPEGAGVLAATTASSAHSQSQPVTIDVRQFEPPRPKWKLDDVTQPRESLVDALMQAVVGRHIGEGRAPRSNRRVVRSGASSRDGPSTDDDPPSDRLARSPRRAV